MTLGLCIVNVHLCRNSHGFLTIEIRWLNCDYTVRQSTMSLSFRFFLETFRYILEISVLKYCCYLWICRSLPLQMAYGRRGKGRNNWAVEEMWWTQRCDENLFRWLHTGGDAFFFQMFHIGISVINVKLECVMSNTMYIACITASRSRRQGLLKETYQVNHGGRFSQQQTID